MKKIISIGLALCLILAMCIPAFAEENKLSFSEYHKLIEDKFGIDITYNIVDGKASISSNTLETLDKALSNMTGPLVKQVSDYYRQRNGKKIEVTYITSEGRYVHEGGDLMAAFEEKTSKIYVFMPSVAGKTLISGENPIAFVHEFAHAFHAMAQKVYGREKMLGEWTALNGGHKYSGRLVVANPDDTVFMSAYASYSFEEDFAEVFSHVFVRNAPGTGFKHRLSRNSAVTGLGKKVAYVEAMIKLVLEDTDAAISNYRRIYDTSSSIKFEGLILSGEYLQYSGYPQPKNVLKGILRELDIESQKSTWIRSIGAWRVIDGDGGMYFVFPGGTWAAKGASQVVESD